MTRTYPVQCAWHLGENEVKDFSVDVSNEVGAGDSVSSATLTADPTGQLTIGVPTISGTLVSWVVSTPVAGTAYNLIAQIRTGTGKIFDVPLLIAGVDKSK